MRVGLCIEQFLQHLSGFQIREIGQMELVVCMDGVKALAALLAVHPEKVHVAIIHPRKSGQCFGVIGRQEEWMHGAERRETSILHVEEVSLMVFIYVRVESQET